MGCFQIEGLILRCLVNLVLIKQVYNSMSVLADSLCLSFACADPR